MNAVVRMFDKPGTRKAPSPNDLKQALKQALPAALLNAESALREVRDKRTSVASQLQALARALDSDHHAASSRLPTAEEKRLTAQLESIDLDVANARAALRVERERAVGVIRRTALAYLRENVPQLATAAQEIVAAADLLAAPDQVAMQHGLDAPGLGALLHEIPQVRRMAEVLSASQ
jgi:hypothetical protein